MPHITSLSWIINIDTLMYNMEYKQIVQNFNVLAADFSSLDDFI